ncbi:hypothetical protein ACOSQ3_018515 [Xanthoceras sorbifolium]
MGACLDKGLNRDHDYSSFVSDDEEEVVLTFDDEDIEDEDASTFSSFMRKAKDISPSGKDIDESSNAASRDTLRDSHPPTF